MKPLFAFLFLIVLAGVLMGAAVYSLPKPDPAAAWCDAPPIDGAGAPEACN
jgi:hypothetical protein